MERWGSVDSYMLEDLVEIMRGFMRMDDYSDSFSKFLFFMSRWNSRDFVLIVDIFVIVEEVRLCKLLVILEMGYGLDGMFFGFFRIFIFLDCNRSWFVNFVRIKKLLFSVGSFYYVLGFGVIYLYMVGDSDVFILLILEEGLEGGVY